MHELTAMIRADLKPALGVAEPGAVAFCAALAKSHLPGDLIYLSFDEREHIRRIVLYGWSEQKWIIFMTFGRLSAPGRLS